jgi:hypothetical protein
VVNQTPHARVEIVEGNLKSAADAIRSRETFASSFTLPLEWRSHFPERI